MPCSAGNYVSVGSSGLGSERVRERERLYSEGGVGKQLCKCPDVLEFIVTVSKSFSRAHFLLQV
jgi:hypothetical protein